MSRIPMFLVGIFGSLALSLASASPASSVAPQGTVPVQIAANTGSPVPGGALAPGAASATLAGADLGEGGKLSREDGGLPAGGGHTPLLLLGAILMASIAYRRGGRSSLG